MRRLLAILTLAGAITAVTTTAVIAAKPPCHGRVVNVRYGHRLRCDVSPPQRLNVHHVPSRAICDDMGGRYVGRTCRAVDY